jgi:SpoVK/Ycf46/Vps4 family AAA+-type ATPase
LANYGLKPRRKILLYGPPGCGKTLGAKRLAWTTGLKFVKIRFDVMISSLFGESAANLRSIFDFCVQNPCLLLLDECDFIARSRVTSRDIGEVQRIVNTLLQLLEDYSFPGMVVATTNIYKELDHALFRRFDDSIEIPLPAEDEIIRLLREALVSVKTSESIDWSVLANELKRLSAADVVKISENAAKSAVLSGDNLVSQGTLSAVIGDFSRLSE